MTADPATPEEKVTAGSRFVNPPVIELALSVQFKPLDFLVTPALGLLYQTFKDRYPEFEEQEPLDPIREKFGKMVASAPELTLIAKRPPPRLWFLTADGTELIQVQRDRFAHNWRKREDGNVYPQYDVIRKAFELELNQFQAFVTEQGHGAIAPDQCEITYVDHFPIGQTLPQIGDLGHLLTFWDHDYADSSLGKPEIASCSLRFVLSDESGDPYGRLHVDVRPALRQSDHAPLLKMQTVGRGNPLGEGLEGALAFLDKAHAKTVDYFLSIIRPEMQASWGTVK